jgi:hypothetical protein
MACIVYLPGRGANWRRKQIGIFDTEQSVDFSNAFFLNVLQRQRAEKYAFGGLLNELMASYDYGGSSVFCFGSSGVWSSLRNIHTNVNPIANPSEVIATDPSNMKAEISRIFAFNSGKTPRAIP